MHGQSEQGDLKCKCFLTQGICDSYHH